MDRPICSHLRTILRLGQYVQAQVVPAHDSSLALAEDRCGLDEYLSISWSRRIQHPRHRMEEIAHRLVEFVMVRR
jgi:hypothetical protein